MRGVRNCVVVKNLDNWDGWLPLPSEYVGGFGKGRISEKQKEIAKRAMI